MKRIHVAHVALLAVGLAAAVARSDQPSAADHVPQIAVVRAAQVTRDCTEWKQMTQAINARLNEMKQEQAKRENEINQLIDQQTQLKAGSAQWAALREQIDDKKLGLEVWAKKMQLELERRQKAGMKSTYDHVAQAVTKIATDRHLDLVLADNSPEFLGPDLDKITPPQLEQVLALRGVLFTTKNADITEDVKTLVEANFKSQAASAGPQTPPAH
jgi:Skp family chaperone for outer membrane proteins